MELQLKKMDDLRVFCDNKLKSGPHELHREQILVQQRTILEAWSKLALELEYPLAPSFLDEVCNKVESRLKAVGVVIKNSTNAN